MLLMNVTPEDRLHLAEARSHPSTIETAAFNRITLEKWRTMAPEERLAIEEEAAHQGFTPDTLPELLSKDIDRVETGRSRRRSYILAPPSVTAAPAGSLQEPLSEDIDRIKTLETAATVHDRTDPTAQPSQRRTDS